MNVYSGEAGEAGEAGAISVLWLVAEVGITAYEQEDLEL